jgi:hypothetical protein
MGMNNHPDRIWAWFDDEYEVVSGGLKKFPFDMAAEYIRADLVDIAKIQDLLHDDLYDSKDWRDANVVERIEWLILMLANKKEEVDMWVEMVIDQGEKK